MSNGRIRNDRVFNQSRMDYRSLTSKLPGSIGMTDVDGMLEVNGHFLFVEAKREGTELTKGQDIALTVLLKRLKGRSCVLIANYIYSGQERIDLVRDVSQAATWVWSEEAQAVLKSTPCVPNTPLDLWVSDWYGYAKEGERGE